MANLVASDLPRSRILLSEPLESAMSNRCIGIDVIPQVEHSYGQGAQSLVAYGLRKPEDKGVHHSNNQGEFEEPLFIGETGLSNILVLPPLLRRSVRRPSFLTRYRFVHVAPA